MKKVIYCLIMLLPILGNAEIQKILEVTAESDTGLLSIMSIDVGSENIANSLIYHPDAKETEVETYPTKELIDDSFTIRSEKGVDVVSMRLKQLNSTSYIVTLHYLYKFKLFNKTYKDKQLNVAFSTPDNRYLVQDADTKKLISKLHFLSNYNEKGKVVGIERIETL